MPGQAHLTHRFHYTYHGNMPVCGMGTATGERSSRGGEVVPRSVTTRCTSFAITFIYSTTDITRAIGCGICDLGRRFPFFVLRVGVVRRLIGSIARTS